MGQKPLTEEQEKFILDNKGKLKIKEIASQLNVTASCVHQHVNPKKKERVKEGCFDIDSECDEWGI